MAHMGNSVQEVGTGLDLTSGRRDPIMMRFPLTNLLDEAECYHYLLQVLHPDGLACPQGHPLPPGQAPHKRDSGAVVSYRCAQCHAVFNLFTGTLFAGTHYTCCILVLFVRGVL